MPPETIDDVLRDLDALLDHAVRHADRIACFAALYRTVTFCVGEGVRQGAFVDGARMERLDVLFARRFLDAWADHARGRPVSASWRAAFDARGEPGVLILQHLLLGMNAHINLDLGIAAVDTVAQGPLAPLHDDFLRINRILGGLLDETQRDLAALSPLFTPTLAATLDDRLFGFSMEAARDGAWGFAERLHATDRPGRDVQLRDTAVAAVGERLLRGGPVGTVLAEVAETEEHDMRVVVETLTRLDRVDVARLLA